MTDTILAICAIAIGVAGYAVGYLHAITDSLRYAPDRNATRQEP